MILTELPDLPPRPETAANAAFRRAFYARWGRENAIVAGCAYRAEYAAIAQNLSIKLAAGAGERYLLPRRELLVDDDCFLILNEGRRYGSRLAGADRPTSSFAVFFRPGLLAEVRAARRMPVEAALALGLQHPPAAQGFEFGEQLRPHGGELSARLAGLQHAVRAGERSEDWLEQQLLLLADAMLRHEVADEAQALARLPLVRGATRREALRRLRVAADCIQSRYADDLSLDDLAAAACLSRYHFVRYFSACFGLSPYAALQRKRAACAQRLLAAGMRDREQVAQRCGFGSRWALARALGRFGPHGAEASQAELRAASLRKIRTPGSPP